MAKVTPISEHFQHFLADLKETFWGESKRWEWFDHECRARASVNTITRTPTIASTKRGSLFISGAVRSPMRRS